MSYQSQHIIPESFEDKYKKFAFPIYKTLERLCQTSNNDLKLIEKRLLETFEITLRFVTHVGVSDFVASGEHNKIIQNQLKGLARPSLGMYSSLIRELAKQSHRSQCYSLSVINAFYEAQLPSDSVFASLCSIAKMFDYKTPKKCNNFKQLIDVLVVYRNKGDAHAVSKSRKDYLAIIPKLFELVQALLDACRPLAEGTFVRVVGTQGGVDGDKYRVENWNADKPTQGTIPATSPLITDHLYLLFQSVESVSYIDLYPFFYVEGYEHNEPGSAEIYSLNEIKKSRLEFVNYQTGAQLVIKVENQKFASILESATAVLATDPLSDGYNPLLEIGVSTEAELKYNHAMVSIKEENFDTAIMLLSQAVEESPLFREALLPLSQLQIEEGDPLGAQETLKEYLELFPADLEFLLADTSALLAAHDTDNAQRRLEQIRSLNPDYPGLALLEQQRMDIDRGLDHNTGVEAKEVLLPYHVLANVLSGKMRHAKVMLAGFVLTFTLALVMVFELQGDRVMALTLGSFGLLWLSVFWANFRMWSVLEKSEPNFASFLRSRKGRTPSAMIRDIVCPILGCYSLNSRTGSFKILLGVYKDNSSRFNHVLLWGTMMTVWFYGVSSYSPSNVATDVCYTIYTFLFSICFMYLLSCLVGFQRALMRLRGVNIHFNIVQHPKLSVRYLSSLSRKVLFPMILVYFLFAFMFYLGPFLANVPFIVVMTLFLLFLSFSYYSTIFLVRSIILQNKWRLISQFSTHFHTPFSNLVTEGKTDALTRIKELMEARDYIDSIDVWAEKKVVLVGMSLFFVAALALSTVGLSNVMTRYVVPMVSRSANASASEVQDMLIATNSPQPEIQVLVENVDDSFLVVWGDSLNSLQQAVAAGISGEVASDHYGMSRCNWSSLDHGSMETTLPVKDEMYILLLGYNKVYKGMLGMGGGKYSHMVNVVVGEDEVIASRKFVRINTKEAPYMVYLKLEKGPNGIKVHKESGPPLLNPVVRQLAGEIEEQLREESAIDIFSSNAQNQ